MCGIVGYIGSRAATPLVMEGLRQLEYRGYDSAGIAVIDADGELQVRRQAGKLVHLERLLAEAPAEGHTAIGHTRWATHGPPCQRNAHPHSSSDGELVVVQNGIVENFIALRQRLQAKGYTFVSDTDTEAIVHLIHDQYRHACAGDLERAVREALKELAGPSAIVVLCKGAPDRLITARLGNAGGVAIGYGEGEMYLASDIPAILRHTRQVTFLEDRQVAVVTAEGARFTDLDGRPVSPERVTIGWDPVAAEKGAYRHFMQKEILEQGRSVADTLRGRLDVHRHRVLLDALQMSKAQARGLSRVIVVACGTSYYAGLVGKFMIEQLAQVPVEVDYGSEFRYRRPILRPDDVVLAITQSGETVDTLAALEEARAHGCKTAAIVNAIGSQAARVCDGVIAMQAGPEIGVASTKAFTASLVDLFLLGLYLGQERGVVGAEQRAALIQAVMALPGLGGDLLAVLHAAALSLPGAGDQLSRRARGRAETQRDQLHPRRGLPGGRDEARPHRADRRANAHGRRRAPGRGVRKDDQPDRTGQGAPRAGARRGARERRGDPEQGRLCDAHPGHPSPADAGAGGAAAAALCLRDRRAAGVRRRPAAQPGQERDGRVKGQATDAWPSGSWIAASPLISRPAR
jgi:glutamine---fructose-6-phosphate transaminase (isomerizing)